MLGILDLASLLALPSTLQVKIRITSYTVDGRRPIALYRSIGSAIILDQTNEGTPEDWDNYRASKAGDNPVHDRSYAEQSRQEATVAKQSVWETKAQAARSMWTKQEERWIQKNADTITAKSSASRSSATDPGPNELYQQACVPPWKRKLGDQHRQLPPAPPPPAPIASPNVVNVQ